MAIILMMEPLNPTSHGWLWVTHWKDGRTTTQRTSHRGDGLWLIRKNGEEKQLLGTCQFSLPQDRDAAIAQLEATYQD